MYPDPDSQNKQLPDTLNEKVDLLLRREIEARLLAYMITALSAEFRREKVIAIVKETIIAIAREQGITLAQSMRGCGSVEFLESLKSWQKDDALQMDILEQSDEHLDFNVTCCRYAEMYQALGIPELGTVLSCNRDFALIKGFNPKANLERSQTIMEGAPYCDFRFRFPKD